jgi:hypothetical protein
MGMRMLLPLNMLMSDVSVSFQNSKQWAAFISKRHASRNWDTIVYIEHK